jgi:hypothetical protein
MNFALAPIALFCFNRPLHLERTLESLMACEGFDRSPIYVFADGPRRDADLQRTAAVRQVLADHLPARAMVTTQPQNVGLARNIVDGVTAVCAAHGRVIVLEDDLVLDPRFLGFMNSALDRYADDPQVYQVAGHAFESSAFAGRSEAMLLPWPSSWGWATWKRAWDIYDGEARGWQELSTDSVLRRRFNLDNAYDYSTMLERQMRGEVQSWAVRWYWSMFRVNGLAVFPPFSLVGNTGFDGSGTHGRGWLRGRTTAAAPMSSTQAILMPGSRFDETLRQQARDAIWAHNGGWLGHAVDRIRRPLGRLRSRLTRVSR